MINSWLYVLHLTFTSPYNRRQFNNHQFIVEQLISDRLHNLENAVRIRSNNKSNFILLYFTVCHGMDEPTLSAS